MSDDEKFVNDWKEYFTISGTFGDWPRLIALARIGASVKPRPIAEAPDAPVQVLVIGGRRKDWTIETSDAVYWRTKYSKSIPTHFMPLSALPQPEPTP